MKKIICLSGLAGSGKTTIGKLLAAHLEVPFLSIGNYSRTYAEKLDMDIHQFQIHANNTPGLDQQIDQQFLDHVKQHGACILDYRLGFYFIPDAFHVLIKIDESEAAKRVFGRGDKSDGQSQRLTLSDHLITLNRRNKVMKERLQKQYEVDFTSEKHYHLIIDTTDKLPVESVEHILKTIQNNQS